MPKLAAGFHVYLRFPTNTPILFKNTPGIAFTNLVANPNLLIPNLEVLTDLL